MDLAGAPRRTVRKKGSGYENDSYWALKVRFYFRFSDQNTLLLTDQNASLLTDQNQFACMMLYKCSCFGVFCIHCVVC
jgi:hypothetical protein